MKWVRGRYGTNFSGKAGKLRFYLEYRSEGSELTIERCTIPVKNLDLEEAKSVLIAELETVLKELKA